MNLHRPPRRTLCKGRVPVLTSCGDFCPVSGRKKNCKDTDQACAALVKDLKQRGLLDETLIIWGGEFGFNATRDRVHVHNLNATILHLLGFDHTRLTYRFQGRDFRLTDVHGTVVERILAAP